MGRGCKLGRKRKYSNRPAFVDRKNKNNRKIVRDEESVSSDTTNFASNDCVTTNFDKTNCNTTNFDKEWCDKNMDTPVPDLPMNSPVVIVTNNTGELEKKREEDFMFQESRTWKEEQYKRSAVAFVFTNVLFFPPRSEWKGKDGAIEQTSKFLQLDNRTNRNLIYRVFLNMEHDLNPGRNSRSVNKKLLIMPGSVEEQIIADRLEEGCSVATTTEFVNIYRRQQNLSIIGKSCVHQTSKRLKPLVSTIGP